jgi:hypothetical protein
MEATGDADDAPADEPCEPCVQCEGEPPEWLREMLREWKETSTTPEWLRGRTLRKWEGVRGTRGVDRWTGEAGEFYWHPKYGFLGVGYKQLDRVVFLRACAKCGKRTLGFAEECCAACGGKREKNPHRKRNEGRQNKRDAQAQALQALLESDDRLEPAPARGEKGEYGVYYAKLNPQNNQKPFVFRVTPGGKPVACCMAPVDGRLCLQQAHSNPDRETLDRCIRHGGGYRCAVEGMHMEAAVPPLAEYKLTANASSVGQNNTRFPRPEMAGTHACMRCLKSYEPSHPAVKSYLYKEHIVVGGIAAELHDRGLGHLVLGAGSITTHDCETGVSRRREDLDIYMGEGLIFDFENDEHQHDDRSTSCSHAKLAGHLVDRGAPSFTKEEGELWDAPHPTDKALDELADTPADTPAMQRLRRARKAANERVLRAYAAQSRARARGDADAVVPKLHCLRFNCDSFVAADGTRVGGLITERTSASDDVLARGPSKLFKPAIVRLVDRILELIELAKDDAWYDAHKTWEVEYWRYDGCAVDGSDGGAVAAAHAARPATDDVSAAGRARVDAYKAAARKRKADAAGSSAMHAMDSDSE